MRQKVTNPGLGEATTAGGETLVDMKIELSGPPTAAPGSGVMVVPPKERLAYGTDPGLAAMGGAEASLVRGLGRTTDEAPGSLPPVEMLANPASPANVDAPTHLRFATDPRLVQLGGATQELVTGLGKGREAEVVLPKVEELAASAEAVTVPRAPKAAARKAGPATVDQAPLPTKGRSSTTGARLRLASYSLGKYALIVVVGTILAMIVLRLAFGPKEVVPPSGLPSASVAPSAPPPPSSPGPVPSATAVPTVPVAAPATPPSSSAPVVEPSASVSGRAPAKPHASHEPKPAGPAPSHTSEPPPKPSATIAPDLQGTF